MSAAFIVPFDNNPSSNPSLKTTSYTVPSGKFAYVNVMHPDISVNGVQIYPLIDLSVGATLTSGIRYLCGGGDGAFFVSLNWTKFSSGTGTSGGSIGFLSGGIEITLSTSSSATVGTYSLGTNFGVYQSMPFIRWTASGAGGGASASTGMSGTGYYFGGVARQFWVKSGSVLAGNGFVVTEYNQIS